VRGWLPAAQVRRRLARCATIARSARQPRPNFSDTNHPKNLNWGFWVNHPDEENGLPQDRRLCADGFIIRAQAMIRADGFRPRKHCEKLA